MIMIRHVNDGYIYVVIWYENDMKYVMVWDMWYENDMKYDILWCNMLRYDMYMMKCYVKSMEHYVMYSKLCVYNMIWMTWNHDKWHEI